MLGKDDSAIYCLKNNNKKDYSAIYLCKNDSISFSNVKIELSPLYYRYSSEAPKKFCFWLPFPFETALDVPVHEGRISLQCTLNEGLCDLHQGGTLFRMALPPPLWCSVSSSYSFVSPKYYFSMPSRPVLAKVSFSSITIIYNFFLLRIFPKNFPWCIMGSQSVWACSH